MGAQMRGATQRYWFVLTVWRTILLLVFGSWAQHLHAEEFVPRAEHYLASAQGMDCSIYRNLARRAKDQVEQSRSLLSGHLEVLKEKREELERCGRARGVESVGGKSYDKEQRLAELCPESYDAWLAP